VSIYVIDASIALKWFVEEDFTEKSLNLISEQNELHAPDFITLEIEGVLCKWIRRNIIKEKEAREIRTSIIKFPMFMHPFTSLQDVAFVIAIKTGQSPYDCLYVALAALLGGKMVTADRKLYDCLVNTPFLKNMAWIGDIG